MSGIRTPGVERLQTPAVEGSAEEELDRSLRPRRLADFVGQDQVKEQLGVFIQAARARDEARDHEPRRPDDDEERRREAGQKTG